MRFAQHLRNLALAIANNLPYMRAHWEKIAKDGDRSERAQAVGFLKLWSPENTTVRLTYVILDLLRAFCNLQQQAQRSLITIADLIFERDRTIQCLTLMEQGPYPGGNLEKLDTFLLFRRHGLIEYYTRVYIVNISVCSLIIILAGEEERAPAIHEDAGQGGRSQRCTPHSTVTRRGRSFDAVRQEIVTSAKNFLMEKLDVEQEKNVKAMIDFANSESIAEMINAGRDVVERLFGTESVSSFSDDVIGLFSSQGARTLRPTDNVGAKLYDLLRRSQPSSVLNKLIQAFIITSPHSMMTERTISCHTELKTDKRSSLSRDTVNDRLHIALNSKGTAYFDPRPSVAKFLSSKERHLKLPDSELYRQSEFAKTFFCEANNL